MDRIIILEEEIKNLRKVLNDKEQELFKLKNGLLSDKKDQNTENLVNKEYKQCNINQHNKVQYGDMLPKWAIERYSRQILLPEIGVRGQKRICEAKVLIIGAGGLGCPAALYLAGAGVGEIGIVDFDTVDITNIHRQVLHGEADEHMSKAESAANTLRSINSHVKVDTYNLQLSSSNALAIAKRYDLVLDCTDNVPTRYLLNDLCVFTGIPLISGSALKMEGQLTIYGYRPNKKTENKDDPFTGPCYRCLFPTPPPPEAVGSCSANGVAGPVPGVIGVLQALEAIKYIVGYNHNQLLVKRLLLFDGEDLTFRNVQLRPKNAQCELCSENATIKQFVDYEEVCKAKAKEKKETQEKCTVRKIQKQKRMLGQRYLGFRVEKEKDSISVCKKKCIQDVVRNERRIGPTCKAASCAGGSKKCKDLEQGKREEIFRYFWNDLDWKGKKQYVRESIASVPPKRRRAVHKSDVSRKGDSKIYHLKYGDDKYHVCRVMFLNTLGIKEAMVRSWLTASDKPKCHRPPIRTLNAESYINSLPRVPPKCPICAQDNVAEYINLSHIKSISQLFNIYTKVMKTRGVEPASRKTFSLVLTQKKLRVFKAKHESDICDDLELHILPPENRITPSQLAHTLNTEDSQRHLLVDVRSEAEFQMCRIDGSVNYPIEKLRGEKFEELLEEIKKCYQVSFICRRGNDSQIAAKKFLDALDEEYRSRIKDLSGGLHAWSKDVDDGFPIY